MIEEDNILIEMTKRHIVTDNKVLNRLLGYDDIRSEYNLRRNATDNFEKSVEKNIFVAANDERKVTFRKSYIRYK